MARNAERTITNKYVLELMAALKCSTIAELHKKTGIPIKTLDSWAYEDGSPLRALETTEKLLVATGEDAAAEKVRAIIQGFRRALQTT